MAEPMVMMAHEHIMQNPAITFSDLRSIEPNELSSLIGAMNMDGMNMDMGKGWGHWAGKYIGATVVGGAGGGSIVGSAIPFVGNMAGMSAGMAGGMMLGYDYGGRIGNWVTGGR